ncbi:hypothetical protein GCM10028784_12260 [Myceligenerans cantabricum]
MTETAFKEALAGFATKPAEELAMTDGLEEVGVGWSSVFELMFAIEDQVGEHATMIGAPLWTVEDLYDHVQQAAALHAA